MTPTLVVLCGPPAVGKMTVGLELAQRTRFALFHNHLSIEAVLPVFEFGSPPFNRLVANFRDAVFAEAAASDLPGFIFTYVWAFDQPSDLEFILKLQSIFERTGYRTVFVELWADLAVRLERNRTETRLAAKPSKRDLDASDARVRRADERYRMTSDGAFPFADRHLRIDNSELPASEAAEAIIAHFGLPRVG